MVTERQLQLEKIILQSLLTLQFGLGLGFAIFLGTKNAAPSLVLFLAFLALLTLAAFDVDCFLACSSLQDTKLNKIMKMGNILMTCMHIS